MTGRTTRRPIRPTTRRAILPLLTAAVLILTAGCGSLPRTASSNGVRVVAAENFWGSIAAQLAGSKGSVQSIIVNPAEDPHSYEPSAADARTLAGAQLVIANGIGYDPWVPRLLGANPTPGRIALTVGSLLHLGEGDNPHRWYDPADVLAVARAIAADLKRLDPNDTAYFNHELTAFTTHSLARYDALIAGIRSRYAGVPVGASESIFALQAPALGLRLLTPPSFMKAVSEGTEVSAQDVLEAQRQISDHRIKVWIFNSQNATPEISQLNGMAGAAGIPVATITETLDPPTDSFEQWQVAQLRAIQQALHEATGR